MRLLIVSHMPHYVRNGEIVGWGPTAQEIDHLSRFFDEVTHIACLHPGPAPPSSLPYASQRVKLIGVPPSGGERPKDKLGILRNLPLYLDKIRAELPKADVVHVRCPANISLMAIVLMALVRRPLYRWVKYAGNWRPETRSPLSYGLQRWFLGRNWHRGTVSVNGQWPGQPAHVYSFPNPSLSTEDIERGRGVGSPKTIREPLQILFVGALNATKGVGRALEIVREIRSRGIVAQLDVVGDGAERASFETWAQDNGLGGCAHFHGWLPKAALAGLYGGAHILLHPTASDGWPKVISEAMAYGVVPIAGGVSSIPQTLATTGAGLACPPHDVSAFVRAILCYRASPREWKEASQAGLKAAPNFTYDSYLERVKEMFQRAWNISLDTLDRPAAGA